MASRTPTDSTDKGPRYRETQPGFWKLQLVVEVRGDGLYIRFDPLHRSFRRIGVDEIAIVEAGSYSAADHGGWHWGIRLGPTGKDTVYRLRGSDGVRVTTADGRLVFVGSESPERLTAALTAVVEGST